MRSLLTAICILFILSLRAQQISIIPQPSLVIPGKGNFTIDASTRIKLEGSGLEPSAHFLMDYLQKFYGLQIKIATQTSRSHSIILNFERLDNPLPGAYRMHINKDEIYIGGDNEEGVFYGVQTLLQLLPVQKTTKLLIPQLKIEDHPRFAYRGMHLDVGRHFFGVDYIRQYIDFIALHKMNYFHWHLTEDQGWRIEIKKYPLLTQVGSCRAGTVIGRNTGRFDSIRYCGYYTQDQIKEIVQYAKDRYITVIPEIDMPGHASAALTAYPFLGCTGGPYEVQQRWGVFKDVFCAGNDSTYRFLQDVLDEVMSIFPSKYIHIGGDECPKDRWKTCPKCQRSMQEHHLANEHELQSYFIRQMENYVSTKGRSIIGWDEILEGGLAPKATVMSWRGEQGGIDAAQQNHDVIMTPGNYVYFDHAERKNEDSVSIGGYLPVEKVYAYEPIPSQLSPEQSKHILGAQANIWSEYMTSAAKLEYMIFPRLTALSEVLWSEQRNRNWTSFSRRLQIQFQRYERWNVNYSKAYYDIQASILPAPDRHGVLWKLGTHLDPGESLILVKLFDENGKSLIVAGNKSKEVNPPIPVTVSSTYEGTLFRVITQSARETKELSHVKQHFSLNKATGKNIKLTNIPLDNFPGNGGAFGLVNGAESDRGLNSYEWLGWQDTDMEAIIDLDKPESISKLTVHTLDQRQGRFSNPSYVEVFGSDDGETFKSLGKSDQFVRSTLNMGNITVEFPGIKARYVKVIAKNPGIIPAGEPYAGSRARILIDEIAID